MFKGLLLILPLLLGALSLQGKTVTLTENNMIQMNNYYDDESVGKVLQKAIELDAKLPAGQPIYLVINSGGGYISAGLKMIDTLNGFKRPVHTITMTAASMGFQTVQLLKGKRYLLDNGTLMSHRARGGFFGEFPDGNLDTRYKHWLRKLMINDELVVKRNPKIESVEQYRNMIKNEYWCDGSDCDKTGFSDGVINANCDKSLSSTYKSYTNMTIQGYPVVLEQEFSECPLQPYVLSWNISFRGEYLWTKPNNESSNRLNLNLFEDEETTRRVVQEVELKRKEINSKEPRLILK